MCLRGSLGGLLRRHISLTAQNPPLQPTQEEANRCTSPLSSTALLVIKSPSSLGLLLTQAVSAVSSSPHLLCHCKSVLSPRDSHQFAQPVLRPLKSSVTVSQFRGVGTPELQANLLQLRNITSLSFNTDGNLESGLEASSRLCWTPSCFVTIGKHIARILCD